MRLLLAAVGRWKSGPERDLFDHYAARITDPPELRQVVEKKPLRGPELKRREAALLLAQVPVGAVVVALDGGGRQLSSARFADRLGRWRDEGVRDIAFLIGGADGLDESVLGKAGLVLSLGPMTWPHLLVPGLLAEQIYRTQCIRTGHPYHRG
jgi:23S rRNA (pseudouridine1915-N3)-methyltransferase